MSDYLHNLPSGLNSEADLAVQYWNHQASLAQDKLLDLEFDGFQDSLESISISVLMAEIQEKIDDIREGGRP